MHLILLCLYCHVSNSMLLMSIIGFILFVGILDNFGLYCGGEKDLLFILGKGNESSFTTIAGYYIQLYH